MFRPDTLDADRAMVLVIDMQTKLLPSIRDESRVVAAARKLLDGVAVFNLPALATEQYPKGLGATHDTVAGGLESAKARVLEKPTFSCCGEKPVREALREIDRPQIIVAGIEAHVCVQQTALDLVAMDYDVFLCADAVGSRGRLDYERSLSRMQHAGAAVTTVESVLFELCNRCDTPQFKSMIEIIKAHPPTD